MEKMTGGWEWISLIVFIRTIRIFSLNSHYVKRSCFNHCAHFFCVARLFFSFLCCKCRLALQP